MLWRPRSWVGGGVGVLVLASLALLSATAQGGTAYTTVYLGVLALAAVGAWVGARRAPRGRRLVPRLIATGVALTALGDVTWSALAAAGARTDVSVADLAYLGSYVVLGAALWLLVGRGRGLAGQRSRSSWVIDALTIAVVMGLVLWIFAVKSIVADPSVSVAVRLLWAAYPVADGVMLTIVLLALVNRSMPAGVGAWFAAGLSVWLVADMAYLVGDASGVLMRVMDAGWLIGTVVLACAVWQEPDSTRPPVGSEDSATARVVVALGPLVVPPVLEVITHLQDQPSRAVELLAGTAALIVLGAARTTISLRAEQQHRRELEAARDEALASSRTKSMILANVSHEIRTPLTAVLATSEILQDTVGSDLERDLVRRLDRSARRLGHVVEGILDFSRIEAGDVRLDRAPFDLGAVVSDLAEVYGLRAEQAGDSFECRLEPASPPRVVGDAARVRRVLAHLLDNALKFTDRGHVGLTVSVGHPEQTPGGGSRVLVDLAVSDTGEGIDAAHHAAVFDSFAQVDGSLARRHGGTGLGLAICRELTVLMGGAITLQSQPGRGSTFVVRLPLEVAADVEVGSDLAVLGR